MAFRRTIVLHHPPFGAERGRLAAVGVAKNRWVHPDVSLNLGRGRKWVIVVAAEDLPRDFANARVPNVIKNPTCVEMRETLLIRPDLFQILNGGVVCTATAVNVTQVGNEQWVEVTFDQDQLQGVVNGGHTYGTVLHVVHDHPVYAEGLGLKAALKK